MKSIDHPRPSRQNPDMCARYTLRSPADLLAVRFGLPQAANLKPRFNVAPSQLIPVIGANAGCPLGVPEPARPAESIAQLKPRCALQSVLPTARAEIPGIQREKDLGRGSMGIVYRAKRGSDDKPVAINTILSAAGADQRDFDR